MKKFTILALITIGTILPANAILENVTNPEQSPIKVSVWCTPNMYIKENLVCTPDKKMCSDGTKSVRSSKPLF